eukprot:jgi/Tetstr1/449615/TSEL_036702.t2
MEHTRRHLALVKRKHEEVSEALEIAVVHRLPAGQGSACVLNVSDLHLLAMLSSNRAVREWRSYAKQELGVAHQVLEGKIVTAAVPIDPTASRTFGGPVTPQTTSSTFP